MIKYDKVCTKGALILFEHLPNVATLKELAEFFKISENTVRRALKSGNLKGFKLGRDWRVEKNEVLKWAATKRNG